MGCVKETKKVGMLKRARNAIKSIEIIDLVKPPATTLAALTTMRNAFDLFEGAAMWLIFYVLMSILVWVHSTMHVQNVTLSYVNFINVNTGTQMGFMLASLLFFVYGAFDYIESTLVKPKEQ